ncbi:MAG: hypothetical protein AAF593_03320 [Planctomycetota bacterium]
MDILRKQIRSAAEFFDNLSKILAGIAALYAAAFSPFIWMYSWIQNFSNENIHAMRIGIILMALGVIVFIPIIYLLNKNSSQSKIITAFFAFVVSVILVSSGVAILVNIPEQPTWERIDVRKLEQEDGYYDLPIAMLYDELHGRHGQLIASPPAYARQIEKLRDSKPVEVQWAAYVESALPPVRMPKTIQIHEQNSVPASDYSIGAYIFTWDSNNDRTRVSLIKYIGFEQVQNKISLPTPKTDDTSKTAVVVFVYPHTLEASKVLPESLDMIAEIK